jgi:hypothetical protein
MLPRAYSQGEAPRRPAQEAQANAKGDGLPKQFDAWGPEHDGLRTRLVPAQEEYVVGRPAKFRLEMKNFSERERTYDSQGVTVNGSIRVNDQDGKPVWYVAGSFQTGGHSRAIAPGQTVVLFDGLDLATQYLLIKPGSYMLQFRGTHVRWHKESEIPRSNEITVVVRPGTPAVSMQVAARLIEILPEKWGLRLPQGVDGQITPTGRESGRGMYFSLSTNPVRSGLKRDVVIVRVWIAERELAWTGKMPERGDVALYLGKGLEGHVYWIVPDKAEAEWPDIRAKITAALQIERPLPQSGPKG